MKKYTEPQLETLGSFGSLTNQPPPKVGSTPDATGLQGDRGRGND